MILSATAEENSLTSKLTAPLQLTVTLKSRSRFRTEILSLFLMTSRTAIPTTTSALTSNSPLLLLTATRKNLQLSLQEPMVKMQIIPQRTALRIFTSPSTATMLSTALKITMSVSSMLRTTAMSLPSNAAKFPTSMTLTKLSMSFLMITRLTSRLSFTV